MTNLIITTLLSLLSATLAYVTALDVWKRRIPLSVLEKTSVFAFLSSVVASCFGIAYFNELEASGLTIDNPTFQSVWQMVLQGWYLPLLALAPLSLFLVAFSIRRNYWYSRQLALSALILEVAFIFALLFV